MGREWVLYVNIFALLLGDSVLENVKNEVSMMTKKAKFDCEVLCD